MHEWSVKNVNWGTTQCPDIATVERLIQSAMNRREHGNLLDFPTKLQMVVAKAKADVTSLAYVSEALYADMWRRNDRDPYGTKELDKVIADIFWARQYSKQLLKYTPATVYPETRSNSRRGFWGSLSISS